MSDNFFDFHGKLVPESGQASTVQGELVRSIGRIADEYATNGFCNWDAGYERLFRFALLHLADGTFGPQTSTGIRSDIDHLQKFGRRENIDGYDLEAAIFRLMEAAAGWCQRHPDPIPHNPDPDLKR